MSTMLTPPRPSASATSATTPGRFGTETRSSCTSPPARSASSSRRRSSRAPSFQRRRASPSPAGERRADLAEPRDRVVDRADQRVGVGEVDVAPDRGVGAGDARDVAEARAGRRQPLALLRQRARGLGDEHVGEHVREVRDRRHQAVVRVGVERRRPRAEAGQQPVQALVERAAGARRRRQVPGRAVEQVGAGVLDAGRLGAGERVAADEARVVDRVDDRALGRADVGDDAVLAGGRERGATAAGSAPTGAATNAASAPVERRGRGGARRGRARRRSSAASSTPAPGPSRAPRAPSRSRAASPIEPPIRPTPTTATRDLRRPGHAARSRAPCRRPPRRARPSRRTRRSRRRAAAAARRRSPRRARGGPRR